MNSLFLFCSDVDAPFARWTKDQVCDWLQEQGLGLYVNMARVWISSGQTLLQASQQDLERVSLGGRVEEKSQTDCWLYCETLQANRAINMLCCGCAQELGIKHPLHKKKLQLALQALGSEEEDNKRKLDYNWVTSECWARGFQTWNVKEMSCSFPVVSFSSCPPRMAGWYWPPSVQNPVWWGQSGRPHAALHDSGECWW